MNRREFLGMMAGGCLAMLSPAKSEASMNSAAHRRKRTIVSLVRTGDRKTGVGKAIELLGMNPVRGREVLLKPNFNTADDFPGSTHNDTLVELIRKLRSMGARKIIIGERSGPPDTADVMKEKGIHDLCRDLKVDLMNFEELPPEQWVRVRPEDSHWRNGFDIAKPVLDSECVVSTCCLKTHGFGGVFTMSLKLSVGVTHKRNMRELHTSFLSMRKMIAEINQAYTPSLIVLDGIEAFVDGGPMRGRQKRAEVILAGTDRVAIDAVGVAVLKELGSNRDIMDRKIFEQEQIARAVELGLGAAGPEEIEIVTEDGEGRKYAERLRSILLQG